MVKNLTLLKYAGHAAPVTSRPSPSALPSRRDRRREETTTDIKTTARAQLAAGGPTAISLRAIARQLGMTPSAVHYYFPGREALIDALIVDGWDSLATALRAHYEQARLLSAHQRWIAVTRAHRAWALEHPSEYLLLPGGAHRGCSAARRAHANGITAAAPPLPGSRSRPRPERWPGCSSCSPRPPS